MKKLFAASLLALFLALPVNAQAEKVDMNNLTCGDLNKLSDESEVAMIYLWLDGYVSAKTGNLVIDTDSVEEDLKALSEACSGNDNEKLLKVLGF